MTVTKILCPTDFSSGADQALRVAVRIARETGAELVVLHAWHIPSSAYALEATFPPLVVQQIADESQRALDGALREATAGGAKHVTGKLRSGVPWTQIVEELETHAYDLCVIGTHGRTGLARIVLGSVAEKVVRLAPCSVLAVRPDAEVKAFRHALVPTDFSDSAAHALELAGDLVEPTGSLTLLHVVELPLVYSREAPLAELAQDLEKRATSALETEVARSRRRTSLPVTPRTRLGSPGAQTLAALDDDRSIDVVIMGSRGRTGFKRVLLGSVAETVVRHARCPVLVARKRA